MIIHLISELDRTFISTTLATLNPFFVFNFSDQQSTPWFAGRTATETWRRSNKYPTRRRMSSN